MNKTDLENLIKECIVESQFKRELKKLVKESIEEVNEEKRKTCEALIEGLQGDLKKHCSDITLERNDAGIYEVKGCSTHKFYLRHLYEDTFDMTHIKNGSERTRKVVATVDSLKEFFKEVFDSSESYVAKAHNKIADNSTTKEGKELPAHNKKVKAEDMVKNEKDLPTAPLRPVESFKRQSEHPKAGAKADYKYPKQTNKKLSVKLKSRRSKK